MTVRRQRLLTTENIREGIHNPRHALIRLHTRLAGRIGRWRADDYQDYYLSSTKDDVAADPAGSVGPAELFDQMRAWQFEFLTDQGLEPDDKFLDIGCGVLRGGIPLIEFLDPGHYTGMDISAEALEVAREELAANNLGAKNPTLINNDDLQFSELAGQTFDMVWAQSVITHLPPEKCRTLLENIGSILAADGVFLATFWDAPGDEVIERPSGTGFEHPLSTLRDWAAEYGLGVTGQPCDHPNDLQCLSIRHL